MNIKSCRAYFQLNGITAGDPTSPVKEFILNFDGEEDTTPLLSPEGEDIGASPRGGLEGVIYDLSGRKVNCQLSTVNCQLPKGIYIHNGKKIFVK